MPSNPLLAQPRQTRGKTVGRAMIRSFIHDILHGQEPGFKPLYTQKRFNTMVEGLASEREYAIYLGYVAVFNGLSEELARSQAYAQQAQHGLLHLQVMLSEVYRARKQAALLDLCEPLPIGLRPQLTALFTSMEMIKANPALITTLESYHHQLLIPALRGISAFETLLTLLAEALDIEELTALRTPTEDILRDIADYAQDIAVARELVHDPLFDGLFMPINMADMVPEIQIVQAVRRTLSQAGVLQTGIVQQLFMQLLGGDHGSA